MNIGFCVKNIKLPYRNSLLDLNTLASFTGEFFHIISDVCRNRAVDVSLIDTKRESCRILSKKISIF